MKPKLFLVVLIVVFLGCSKESTQNPDVGNSEFWPCENGMAGIYPCSGYDLLARIPLRAFEATTANDIWGWTDTTTGKEYVLLGLDNGTAFVDITDDNNLIYLGKLGTATVSSPWRDIKVYNDHAFIVSEAKDHGMQVFDLTRLRSVGDSPQTFEADALYTNFGDAHNIAINEQTGFAYVVGSETFGGGAHFISAQNPETPQAAGGYAEGGYTHDAQVVNYHGPDADYTGKEIFIGANEDQVSIVDVTDKSAPQTISVIMYENSAYTHQGWFTEDHRYFIVGDEQDETDFGFNSRTLVFDLVDLENPVLHTTYFGKTEAIDHNGYAKGNKFYLANYTAGVRVLDISRIDSKTIVEEGFFDSYPKSNSTQFEGVWSVYPYFSSEKIVLSDINSGLFIIKESE